MRMTRNLIGGLLLSVVMLAAPGCALKTPYFVTTDTHVGYSKVGTSVCNVYLGVFENGDCSIAAAMANGGISKIHHVDQKNENYLGLLKRTTIFVYGE